MVYQRKGAFLEFVRFMLGHIVRRRRAYRSKTGLGQALVAFMVTQPLSVIAH